MTYSPTTSRRRATAIIVGAGMTTALACVAAAPAHADYTYKYWSTGCDYGRACMKLAHPNPTGEWWNLERCGLQPVHDYFAAATAHGNTFRVNYSDDRADTVWANTSRALDPHNLTDSVYVFCQPAT